MGQKMRTWALLLGMLALVAGCAHQPGLGEERVVECSARKTPGWVKAAEPVVEAKQTWLFRGMVTHAASLEMGLRGAEADAKKRLVGLVSELVEADYTEYATSSGGGEARYAAEGISWASQGVALSGVRPARTYWERVAVRLPSGLEYYWRAWCQLEVGREDLERARKEAAAALVQRRRGAPEREAEEEAKRLRQRLEGR